MSARREKLVEDSFYWRSKSSRPSHSMAGRATTALLALRCLRLSTSPGRHTGYWSQCSDGEFYLAIPSIAINNPREHRFLLTGNTYAPSSRSHGCLETHSYLISGLQQPSAYFNCYRCPRQFLLIINDVSERAHQPQQDTGAHAADLADLRSLLVRHGVPKGVPVRLTHKHTLTPTITMSWRLSRRPRCHLETY